MLANAAGAFALLAAPARADDAGAIAANIALAAAGVTSFVVETRILGATGVTGTMTFVRPQRIKSEYTIGQMAVQMYLVDGMVYIHAPAGGWHKMNADALNAPPQSMNVAEGLNAAKVTQLADRLEDGASVGVLQIESRLPAAAVPVSGAVPVPAAAGPQTLVCSYDKATYRLRVCTNDVASMTYSRYNDAANLVVLPREARNATVRPPPAR